MTDTLKKIVKAVDAANKSENKIVKLVLMNSVGVRNKGLEVIPILLLALWCIVCSC